MRTIVCVRAVYLFAFLSLILRLGVYRRFYWYDDAYITFSYARNLACGMGWVLSPGGTPALGTSAPLYAIFLALLARLHLDIVASGILVSIVSDTGLLLALFLVLRTLTDERVAVFVAALYAVTLYPLKQSIGMETLPALLGVMMFFHGYVTDRKAPLVACSTFVALIRPDFFVLPLVVCLTELIASRGAKSWMIVGVWMCLPFGALAAFLHFRFGSIIPASWEAKLHFDPTISGQATIAKFASLPEFFPLYVFALVGVGHGILSGDRKAVAMALAIAAYYAAFFASGPPDMPWYYVPGIVYVFLFSGLGMKAALHWHARRRWSVGTRPLAWPMACIVAAACAMGGIRSLRAYEGIERIAGHDDLRESVGRQLGAIAKPGESVAAYEVGKLAYYSKMRVLDLLGLTDRAAMPFLSKRDLGAWVKATSPRFVFVEESADYLPARFQKERWFLEGYAIVQSFEYPWHRSRYLLWQAKSAPPDCGAGAQRNIGASGTTVCHREQSG